jgi:hypothetical protein
MTQQQKDKLNKELCGLLGICWHEEISDLPDHFLKHHRCSCEFKTYYRTELFKHLSGNCNPDFTSEAGRVQLLEIMRGRTDWFSFLWQIMPDVPAREESGTRMLDNYILNKTGNLATAARDFLKEKSA